MEEDGPRVGVDVGGTFTDLVTVRDGRVHVDKTPTTSAEPEKGVLNGLEGFSDSHDRVAFLGHGTTVATNAVLEGEWADTALLTTAGFRDALEIGRQNRPDIYDFTSRKPTPVVERNRRFEVHERVDERGEVLEPLDEESVHEAASNLQELESSGIESIAISLLFSFEHPDHERRVREILREEGFDVSISLSSEVLPEIREYERTLATSLNAALKPVMDNYLGALSEGLAEDGLDVPLRVMGSNGGLMAASVARKRPVNTLLSGPAAGVLGATHIASRRNNADLITLDMGGTSCDVSLVRGGDPLVTTDTQVGDYDVSVPAIDVHTVGAGGGSIASLDAGGALRVGPQSAGAEPGPICYGRGGTDPTITDAHLLLGRINPAEFLPDALSRDANAVREAFEPLAEAISGSVEDAAMGVLNVANANMERAVRVVSVERGYDPREFSLVAYGGAGPLHATALADALDIPEVIIPRAAGVLSALGLLISDITYDYSSSMVRPIEEVSPETLESMFSGFEATGSEELASTGHDEPRCQFERAMDLRYAGQSFDLTVSVDDRMDATELETVVERFHSAHERRYGHAYREEPVELVTVRLRARGLVEPPEFSVERAERDSDDAVTDTREMLFNGDVYDVLVYDRERLPTESAFDGPAVIEGPESTVVVHPDQRTQVDEDANLVVEIGGEQ